MSTYNTADLRRQNRSRVFRYIFDSETPVTKQEIAQSLSLSLPTVGQNLKELQECGLLETQGTFHSTGGRKPRAIGVAAGVRCAMGIMISVYHIHMVCIDLRANLICQTSIICDFAATDEYFHNMAVELEQFLDEYHIDRDHLLGVGVALPGIVDEAHETVTLSPFVEAEAFPTQQLKQYIPYPCFIENDANAGGIAEWWNHKDREHESMVYLSVQRGVGGAVLMNGVSYMGHHHHSGEFGHMCIVPHGDKCLCGMEGCLEAYCSTARISTDLGITREEFFEGLERGNPDFQKRWDKYLDYLAIGINNIRMVLDCNVVLGGVLAQFMEPYIADLRQRLCRINPFNSGGSYLELSRYRSWSTCVGVALHFISEFIDSI